MRTLWKNILGILLVLACPALYMAVIGRFGWSDTDDGFILGYAWRILSGEVPYRDFVSVRPPLSMYLHAFWFWLFPEPLVYVGARYVYVLQLLVSALLATRLLREQLGSDHAWLGPLPWHGLALVGFALSVGALTPMPWHTVDGIFFAVLGLYLLARPARWWVIPGSIALLLACMAKQSFYPLPALYIAILWQQKRRMDALWLLVVLGGLVVAFCGWLQRQGALDDFLSQTGGATTLQDAVNAGVLPYVRLPLRPLLWGGLIAWMARWAAKRSGVTYADGNDVGVIALVFLLEGCYQYHKRGEWFDVQSLGLAQVLFALAIFGLVVLFRRGAYARQAAVWLAGLLGVAWCSSISWGFKTPILFATPLMLGTFLLLAGRGQTRAVVMTKGTHVGLAGLVVIALLPTWHPYRDGARSQLVCDLGTVSQRLSYVVSTQDHCDQLSEALDVAASLANEPVVFLPAFTLQGYLAGIDNPLPSNWPMLAEIGHDSSNYLRAMDEQVHHVVIDRREGDEFSKGGPDGKFFVPSVEHVRRHWHLLQRGRFYEVYANPLLMAGGQRAR